METIGSYMVILFGVALILFNKPIGDWNQRLCENILNKKFGDSWYFRGNCIVLGLVFVLPWIGKFWL